jgi:hypothetical protein
MKALPFFTIIGALTMASTLPASHAFADDDAGVTFVTSIGYQHKLLDFDQHYTAGVNSTRSIEFEARIPTANISFTTAYKRLFAALKYETSLTESNVSADESTNSTNLYYLNIPGENTEVTREDMSLTLGYNVWNRLNLFVGYMKGKTELSPQPGCTWIGPATSCATPPGLLNLALDHQVDGLPEYQQTYEEDGPYIGASYAWQIADVGSLSFSAAYADMDGEYRDNYSSFANQHFKYTGDSTGTSYGLTWTAPLGEQSNYFIDLRRQEYDMDAKDDTGFAIFSGAEVETEETMTGITAGIQAYF